MADKLDQFVNKWNMSVPTYKLSAQMLKNPNKAMMVEALAAVLNMIGLQSNYQQVDSDGDHLHYAVDLLNNARFVWQRISSDTNVCLKDILYPTFKRSVSILMVLHNYALFVQMTNDKLNATVSKKLESRREGTERRKGNIETIHQTKLEIGQLQSNLERLEQKIPTSEEKQKLQLEKQEIEQDLEICAVTKQKLDEQKRDLLDEIFELTDTTKSLEELESGLNLTKRSMGKTKSKLEQIKTEVRLKRLDLRTLDQEHKEVEERVALYETIEEANQQISKEIKLYNSLGEEPEGLSYIKARVSSQESELIAEKEKLSKLVNEKKQIAMKVNKDWKADEQKVQFLKTKLDQLKIGEPAIKHEIEEFMGEISAADDLINVLSTYPEGIRKVFQKTIDLIEQKAQEVEGHT